MSNFTRHNVRDLRYKPPTPRSSGGGCGPLVLLAIIVVIAVGIGGCVLFKSSERSVTTTVTDKERVCDSDSDCKYLVFTEDGTFQLTDSLIYGQFTSSDRYGRIKEDRTYSFQVAGWRLGFFSAYPTIVSDLKEVNR